VLFGIASLRARTYPAAFSIAILVAGALIPWTTLPVGILLGLAFAGLGMWMLRTPTVPNRLVGEAAR
jgi:hypothetical protein